MDNKNKKGIKIENEIPTSSEENKKIEEPTIKDKFFNIFKKKESKKNIIANAKESALNNENTEKVIKNAFDQNLEFDPNAYVSLRHIDKIYDNNVQAVFDFNLDVQKHEFIVLVGPSGCGKSTTLRMVAGLEEISAGELYIDKELSNDLAPKDRNIAMVFQSYALYPHMTVYDNLAFGLKMTRVPAQEIKERVLKAAKILQIEEYLDRKPKALSGGQRQRVALGRAIVRNAKVFLMDEPLSNLDAKLRVAMRAEIIKLHESLKATTIYVTHDQTEAMTMASRIVVMNKGYIQQIGAPIDIYNKPANTFVASFIGAPAMNLAKVKHNNGTITFEDGNTLKLPNKYNFKSLGKEIIIGIRPEDVHTTFVEEKDTFPIEIKVAELLGHEYYVHTQFGGIDLISKTPSDHKIKINDKCFVRLDLEKLHLFDAETQMRID